MIHQSINQPILVIDDDPGIRFLLLSALHTYGYPVDAVEGRRHAEQRLAQSEYRGLIIDVQLASDSGVVFLRDLRCRGISLPTLLMSGAESCGEDSDTTLSPASFVQKPFALADLRLALIQVFGPPKALDTLRRSTCPPSTRQNTPNWLYRVLE